MNSKYQRAGSIAVLIAGIFLRFYHLFRIDFLHEPFRLGGLFVAFAEQIIQNRFSLPKVIPFYSQGGIPFAYPPLGFYVEAVLLSFFPKRQILIANLLPPFVAALTLLAVFFFLRWYYKNQEAYILAGMFAYAFLPPAFSNQIEAAGVAEAVGSLVLVFFFFCGIRYRLTPNWTNAALTGLALGLSILSSPGSAIGVSFLCVVFGLEILVRRQFSLQTLSHVALVAGVGMLISAPYWLTVISYHGIGIFFYPVLAQYTPDEKLSYTQILFENLMDFAVVRNITGAFLWNLVVFLGMARLVTQRQWALPVSFLMLFAIPREGDWLIALPAALLFAVGCMDVFLSLVRPISTDRWQRLGYSIFIVMAGYWMASQSLAVINAAIADKQQKISSEQIKLLQTARGLIPVGSKVLIIGDDALLEWAPYELQREVINERFGLEWKPTSLPAVMRLNKKISQAQSWDDITVTLARFQDNHTIYVVLSDKTLLNALNHNSAATLQLKLQTQTLQVGVLNMP